MNTKGIKFLAVLAVLAMAFAVFAVVTDSETSDAKSYGTEDWTVVPALMADRSEGEAIIAHPETYTVTTTGSGTTSDPIKVTVTAVDVPMHKNGASNDGAWIGFGVVLSGVTTAAGNELNADWSVKTAGADSDGQITYSSDVAGTKTKGAQTGVSFYKDAAKYDGETFYYSVAKEDTTKYYAVKYNLSYSSDKAATTDGYFAKADIKGVTTYYPDLNAAIDAVHNLASDRTATITLLGDYTGLGFAMGYNTIVVTPGDPGYATTTGNKVVNITVDFAGYTYTVHGGVGSTGTETNGCQLLKDATVVLKNGTLTTDSAKILIQNYCTLTLQDLKVDGTKSANMQYVFSNNFGTKTVTGATEIIAPSTAVAFDVWYGMSSDYKSGVSVVFDDKFTGTVKGKIEYGIQQLFDEETVDAAIAKTKVAIKSGTFENLSFAKSGTVLTDLSNANIIISGGVFSDLSAVKFTESGKAITISDGSTYTGNLAIAKNVTVNVDEAVAVKVVGNVTVDTAAQINVAKGASFTATGTIAEGITIKTAGSDQPVDVEETDASGKIDGKDVAEYIKDNQSSAIAEATVVTMNNSDAIKDAPIVVEKADVTFVAGTATTLTGVNIEVKASTTDTNSVTFTGFTGGVSGTITTTNGTDKQTVVLDGVKGTFTITRGSVIIDDAVITGGSFKVSGGVEVKINGSVDAGTFTILMADDAKATDEAFVTVVSDADKSLEIKTGATFKIDDPRITLNVEGKLFGAGDLVSKGDIIVYNGGKLAVTDDVQDVAGNAIEIIALSGATITGKITFNVETSKLIAYSGSNINDLTYVEGTLSKTVGRDADGGEWTYIPGSNKLVLTGYEGTYNFGSFANAITAIDVNGVNKVTYTFASTYTNAAPITLFGLNAGAPVKITAITSGYTGSLEIVVDLSKVSKEALFQTADNKLTVMELGVAGAVGKNINGANISITVKGENAAWTATETGKMNIIGINAANGFVTYNSSIELDIMSAYSAKGVVALNVPETGINVDNAVLFSIKSAGTAINSSAAANVISNSDEVLIEGKTVAKGAENVPGFEAVGRNLTLQTVKSITIKGGMRVAALNVLNSNVTVAGKAIMTDAVTETNSSSLSFTGTATFQSTVDVKQISLLSLKNAVINNVLTNEAVLDVTGDVVVADAGSIVNKGVMTNSGVIGVYGTLDNKGSFTNKGAIEVMMYTFDTDADKVFEVENDTVPTAAANARIMSITLDDELANTTWNADGSADVSGTVKFKLTGGAELDVAFSGTLMPSYDGSYKLVLANEKKTATIALTFNNLTTGADAPKIGGKSYTLAVTGTVVNGSDDVFYLASNATTATVKGVDGMLTKFEPSTAKYQDEEDSIVKNEGDFIVSAGTASTVTINGTFEGDLVTNITSTVLNGTFAGNLAANEGTVTLNAEKSMNGNISAKGLVTISGSFVGDIITDAGVTASGAIIGNITAKGNVVVTDILGNVTVDANGELTVNVKGNMLGTITYISKYKATKDAKDGEETTYTAEMDVIGATKDGGFTIILAAGSDATASAAVVPGFFKINGTMADLETGKTVELTLTQGKLLVDSIVKMKANYYLVIEKDTTIEVNKSAASLDVTEAALKVSKDATANFETGSGTPVNYGKVIAIMSFTIDDGAYSIYSDVAYALTNCNENSTLTVETDAPINSNVDIKKGVNIIVKNVTLTFNGLDVDMDEGAKITLEGTGKIVFKGTEKDATGDENIYYTVSGTIVYDDENVIVLDEVRFVAETTNTIEGVAATSTAASKMKVALTYNCGKVTINDGYATGSVELANGELAWKDVTADPTLIAGTFIVGADAVFDATSLKDAYGVSKYKTSGDDYVVDDVVALPTKVGVEGTLNLLDATSIKGVYGGNGLLTIAKKLTIEKGDFINAEDTPFKDEPGVIGLIVSDKDGCNKLALALLAASTKAADDPIVIAAEKVKDVDALTIAGDVGVGSIIGEESAYLKGVTVYEDAAITAPTVYVITAESTAFGSVGAQTIYMKSTDSSYAKLNYQVEYEVGEYTFYSYFASIDLDVISDITIADSFNLSALVKAGTTKVDLTGKDVNIVIADEKTLTIDIPLIIGTPIDSIGAEGSSIVGKVIIANSAAPDYRYIVAYADVDLTLAEIYQQGGKVEAVYSFLTIDDILYATIFANEGTFVGGGDYGNGVGLSYVDKSMIPDIEGYIFTKWSNLNEDPNAAVGETSAYANAKAISVTVIVKFAEGVSYYLDGVEFAIYDTPTKVEYNSVFTAKINNTAKYQGTPLINGKNSFIVTEDATLTVSGVTPIPEPEPEPVIGDSGISLTDILLIVLVVLIAIMVVILVLRLNRS